LLESKGSIYKQRNDVPEYLLQQRTDLDTNINLLLIIIIVAANNHQ